jgi:hypothetical protein
LLYQLPNGKVIQLTLEQFLEMTDEDEQYLISIGWGEYIHDPFYGSAAKKPRQNYHSPEREIDFREESDEPDYFSPSGSADDEPGEEMPDFDEQV